MQGADLKAYGSYEEVLSDPHVDVVYMPLPTSLHVEWVVKATAQKKHVLLEKPPALSMEDMAKVSALGRFLFVRPLELLVCSLGMISLRFQLNCNLMESFSAPGTRLSDDLQSSQHF
jgi:hypothetical protein